MNAHYKLLLQILSTNAAHWFLKDNFSLTNTLTLISISYTTAATNLPQGITCKPISEI